MTTETRTEDSRATLFALAAGTFSIGTTEFAPMGLLPIIADGVDVSIPTAGTLVTAYAVGVMISGPIITLLLSQISKRAALLALMSVFIIGNLISAIAPDYLWLMVGRVITSLCQGGFFGFGAVVATQVVVKEKQASAVATMFMGASIANIGGVPLASWIGQEYGWRMVFICTAMLGAFAMLTLFRALPRGEKGYKPDMLSELKSLMHREMLTAVSLTVLFASAFFALYTYVAPLLQQITGASGNFITGMLLLIGLSLTAGNWLGGKLADWSLDGATAIGKALLCASLLLAPLFMTSHTGAALTLSVWAVAAFIIVPPLQLRAMHATAEAPSLGSALNMSAFNFGNAIGAIVGGSALQLGYGYNAIPLAGGVIAAAGLVLLWLARRSRPAAAA
ncbi:MFS transporter [Marinobacterium sp. YM272]|uniref:MFS transporter n=1 Tax=Marinobacterium sp. YM272 TaxID=3421654 RepID=UPI003D7F551B